MRQLLDKVLFFLRCLFFLRTTPRGLRLAYADWCLAVGEEPIEVAPGLILQGDQCTSVFFSTNYLDIAVNAAGYTDKLDCRSYTGVSIQCGSMEKRKWDTVYRANPPIFHPGEWISIIRAALKSKIKPSVTPLPVIPLREAHD